MNPADWSDPLAFRVAAPTGERVLLISTSYDFTGKKRYSGIPGPQMMNPSGFGDLFLQSHHERDISG